MTIDSKGFKQALTCVLISTRSSLIRCQELHFNHNKKVCNGLNKEMIRKDARMYRFTYINYDLVYHSLLPHPDREFLSRLAVYSMTVHLVHQSSGL